MGMISRLQDEKLVLTAVRVLLTDTEATKKQAAELIERWIEVIDKDIWNAIQYPDGVM